MPVIINGTTGIDTVQDGIVTDAKLNLTANSQEIKDAINATGSAPIYAARAWVNFNGTGTVAIRASGNVSSITDNGTGDYTVNFATAMPDVNYSVSGMCQDGQISGFDGDFGMMTFIRSSLNSAMTTSSVRIATKLVAQTNYTTLNDMIFATVHIFR
jgi:hypothetical protein